MSEKDAAVLVLRPEVVSTVIEEGAVLLNLETNNFYEVNSSGWAILQLFEAGTTLDQAMQRCQEWGAVANDPAVTQFLDVIVSDVLVIPSEWPATTAEVTRATGWSTPIIQKAPEALQRLVRSPFDPTLPLAE